MDENGSATWAYPVSIEARSVEHSPAPVKDQRTEDMKLPSVSVIIIFLDEERFIHQAIESVFCQTYGDWELLLVDDGSRDASTQIARRCAEQNPGRVQYLEHESHRNRGMSASRNLGLHHAKGDYIAFLDADDVWLPAKLERQLAIMKSQPVAAMVCGPVQWWYSWTGNADDVQRDFVVAPSCPPDTLLKPPQLLIHLLQHETVTTTSGLLRRQAIDSVGGFEEIFHGLYEDQAFCAKFCLKAPVFVASECWYRWRKHPDSSCSVAVTSGEYRRARVKFLEWLEAYLHEQRITNSRVWSILRRELWRSRHPRLERIVVRLQRTANKARRRVMKTARRVLPAAVRDRLRSLRHGSTHQPPRAPPVGAVDFGSLRRLMPVSRIFGFDRGVPIDRYYIERFLADHATDIRGNVLEIGDSSYTRRFGGDRVTRSDVLHAVDGNPQATLVADLTCADHLPSAAFDCIICTQTLMFIFDIRAALQALCRMLKPQGVLLVTVAGVSHQISRHDMDRWGDYWRFTSLSVRLLFEEIFPPTNIAVRAEGNVLAAMAFLHGLVVDDLRQEELDHCDPDYEVSIGVRAVKPDRAP
jgi:glycosyltransferase involved in cell wall biosynthesis/SAM-dependent methyltransferase